MSLPESQLPWFSSANAGQHTATGGRAQCIRVKRKVRDFFNGIGDCITQNAINWNLYQQKLMTRIHDFSSCNYSKNLIHDGSVGQLFYVSTVSSMNYYPCSAYRRSISKVCFTGKGLSQDTPNNLSTSCLRKLGNDQNPLGSCKWSNCSSNLHSQVLLDIFGSCTRAK